MPMAPGILDGRGKSCSLLYQPKAFTGFGHQPSLPAAGTSTGWSLALWCLKGDIKVKPLSLGAWGMLFCLSVHAGNQILENLFGFCSFGLGFNSYCSFMHTKKVRRSWGGWKIELEFLWSLRALASPETTLLLFLKRKSFLFSLLRTSTNKLENLSWASNTGKMLKNLG